VQLNAQLCDGRMICEGSSIPRQAPVAVGNLCPNRMLAKQLKEMRPPLVTIDKSGHGLRENLTDFQAALRQFATTELIGPD